MKKAIKNASKQNNNLSLQGGIILRTFRRLLTLTLTFIMAMGIIMPARLQANNISVTIDGQQVNFNDQQPVLVDGRTLVPVRGVFEALGFDVGWHQPTQTVTLTNAGYIVSISVGSQNFTTNGQSYALDVPAQIIGGRTMIPLRAVLESVGYELDWDGASSTVLIMTDNVHHEDNVLVLGDYWDYGDYWNYIYYAYLPELASFDLPDETGISGDLGVYADIDASIIGFEAASTIVGASANNTAVVGGWTWPLNAGLTVSTGWNFVSGQQWRHDQGRPRHAGLDIVNNGNRRVLSAAEGRVVARGHVSGQGHFLTIRHNLVGGGTVYTFYDHLRSPQVSVGTNVSRGQHIGYTHYGNFTHVHFAMVDRYVHNSNRHFGWVAPFTGDRTTFQGVTFFNPRYILNNNRLPGGGATPPQQPQPPNQWFAYPGRFRIIATNGLNLRPNANSSGNPILTIPRNTELNVTEVSNGWGRATHGNRTGWISLNTRYVLRIGDLPAPPPANIRVTGVSIARPQGGGDVHSVTVGQARQLTANVTPANATNRNVTWSSDNTSIATVNSSGQVRAVAPGTAGVRVTTADGNHTAWALVHVTQASVPVTGVTISGASTRDMTVGQNLQLTANVTPTNATTRGVTWSSSNNNVATVTSSGNVRAVGAGTATITVRTTDGNRTASVTVRVANNNVTISFRANGGTGTMQNQTATWGTITQLNRNTFTRANHTFVGWSDIPNSNSVFLRDQEEVAFGATFDHGTVLHAVWRQTTTPVTGISISGASTRNMTAGNTLQLTANITPTNATNRTVNWTSSNTGVATVSSNGLVEARSAGTAIIRATADRGPQAQVTVNVTANTVTLSFHANGGSGTMSNQAVNRGVLQQINRNAFTRANHTFEGWAYTANGRVEYIDQDMAAFTANRTLHAVWRQTTTPTPTPGPTGTPPRFQRTRHDFGFMSFGESVSFPVVRRSLENDFLELRTINNDNLAIVRGTGPFTLSITGLPSGLSFDPITTQITGTPTSPAMNTVTILFQNATGSYSADFTFAVAPNILGRVLPPGTVGAEYNAVMEADSPGTWSVGTVHPLPRGLSLDPNTGAITGVPQVAGTFHVAIGFRHTSGAMAGGGFTTITINPAP